MTKEARRDTLPLDRSMEYLGVSPYLKKYVTLLLNNLKNYVKEDFEPLALETVDDYPIENCLSQKIIGNYIAYTAIDGNRNALICFAESYGQAGITDYDELAEDSLCDFLNLQNGLFAVEMSNDEKLELSLEVPSPFHGDLKFLKTNTYILPLRFPFGMIRFILSEAQLSA